MYAIFCFSAKTFLTHLIKQKKSEFNFMLSMHPLVLKNVRFYCVLPYSCNEFQKVGFNK